MIPQLLVSQKKKHFQLYIRQFCSDKNISQSLLFNVEPFAGQFTIEQIKELGSVISVSSPCKRMFVIWSFELISVQIQNTLLKLLEEQSERDYFLLCTANPDSAIDTIRSRVRVIQLDNDEKIDMSVNDKFRLLIEEMHKGYGFLNNRIIPKEREGCIDFLDEFSLFSRVQLIKTKQTTWVRCLEYIGKTKELLINSQVQTGLSIDNLLISIKKTVTMK